MDARSWTWSRMRGRHGVMAVFVVLVVVFAGLWPGWTARTDAQDIDARKTAIREYTRSTLRDLDTEDDWMSLIPNIWISSDGSYNSASSWSLGAVPDPTHVAVWDGTSQVDCVRNMSTPNPAGITITDSHYGSIGGPGNYLITGNALAKAIIAGRGDCYISTVQKTVPGQIIVMHAPHAYVEITASHGTYTYVWVYNTHVVYAGSYYHPDYLSVFGERSRVTLNSLASANNDIKHIALHGGILTNLHPCDASNEHLFIQSGGEWIQESPLTTKSHIRQSAGIMRYKPISDPASSPRFYINGTLDLREAQYVIDPGLLAIGPQGRVLGDTADGEADIRVDLRQDNP